MRDEPNEVDAGTLMIPPSMSVHAYVKALLSVVECPLGPFPGVKAVPPGERTIWRLRWTCLYVDGYPIWDICDIDNADVDVVEEWIDQYSGWLCREFGSARRGITALKHSLVTNIAIQRMADRDFDAAKYAEVATKALGHTRKMHGYDAPEVTTTTGPNGTHKVETRGPGQITEQSEIKLIAWRQQQMERLKLMSSTPPSSTHSATPIVPTS